MITVTREITTDNLPQGIHYENDGAAWEAVRTRAGVDDERDWWRWQPMNGVAFHKGEPTGQLYNTYPGFGINAH